MPTMTTTSSKSSVSDVTNVENENKQEEQEEDDTKTATATASSSVSTKKRKRNDHQASASSSIATTTTATKKNKAKNKANDKGGSNNKKQPKSLQQQQQRTRKGATKTKVQNQGCQKNLVENNDCPYVGRRRRFYAVRPSSFVQGPVIFWNWDDFMKFCNLQEKRPQSHVKRRSPKEIAKAEEEAAAAAETTAEEEKEEDEKEKQSSLQYEIFDTLEDAIDYVSSSQPYQQIEKTSNDTGSQVETIEEDTVTAKLTTTTQGKTSPQKFRTKKEIQWDETFKKAAKYYFENGHAQVPVPKGCSSQQRALHHWIKHQRRKLTVSHTNSGNKTVPLLHDQIYRLNSIGIYKYDYIDNAEMNDDNNDNGGSGSESPQHQRKKRHKKLAIQNPGRSEQWEKTYRQASQYYQNNGTVVIENTHLVSSELKTLNAWIARQRKKLSDPKDKSLSEDQKRRLQAITIMPYSFSTSQSGLDDKWESKYQQCLQFYNEHGHCRIPAPPKGGDSEYKHLFYWLQFQRKKLNGKFGTASSTTANNNSKNRPLTDDQKTRLIQLGIGCQKGPGRPRLSATSMTSTSQSREGSSSTIRPSNSDNEDANEDEQEEQSSQQPSKPSQQQPFVAATTTKRTLPVTGTAKASMMMTNTAMAMMMPSPLADAATMGMMMGNMATTMMRTTNLRTPSQRSQLMQFQQPQQMTATIPTQQPHHQHPNESDSTNTEYQQQQQHNFGDNGAYINRNRARFSNQNDRINNNNKNNHNSHHDHIFGGRFT